MQQMQGAHSPNSVARPLAPWSVNNCRFFSLNKIGELAETAAGLACVWLRCFHIVIQSQHYHTSQSLLKDLVQCIWLNIQ